MLAKARFWRRFRVPSLKLLITPVRLISSRELSFSFGQRRYDLEEICNFINFSSHVAVSCVAVTTIRPRLGIMNYMDYRRITVADLPGLIEGAHLNIGMGHNFLKHVERTKLLLFIVDVQGFQLSAKHMRRSCLETVVLLNKEIELYKPDLLKMPTAIIINKMDTDNADGILEEIKPMLENLSEYVATCPEEIQPNQVVRFDDILSASLIMKNDREITTIKERIRDILDKYEEQQHVAVNGDSLDSQLVERIKRQTERQAPTVV
ncbi:GTP-binding protein 10-like protein [Ooceraea biroi]|uniref:GTP-binding protein 10-like protein n=1 Tax=Ooceraea biroi TaxID=2015173 RepID=A0A026WTH1_OOCBI|nr:GTP-binding protein 10-like protein [Ooceraea biroi]